MSIRKSAVKTGLSTDLVRRALRFQKYHPKEPLVIQELTDIDRHTPQQGKCVRGYNK